LKTYTRKGDNGSTSLAGGRRVTKNHVRIEAYGSIDELIAWTGLLMSFPENLRRQKTLAFIQDQLMKCAAALAFPDPSDIKAALLPEPESVSRIEKEIDDMESALKPLKKFIIPGGSQLVSYCNITRCVCRRAERRVVQLNETEKVPGLIMPFLNRLSYYFFVLIRKISSELDIEEVSWTV